MEFQDRKITIELSRKVRQVKGYSYWESQKHKQDGGDGGWAA